MPRWSDVKFQVGQTVKIHPLAEMDKIYLKPNTTPYRFRKEHLFKGEKKVVSVSGTGCAILTVGNGIVYTPDMLAIKGEDYI